MLHRHYKGDNLVYTRCDCRRWDALSVKVVIIIVVVVIIVVIFLIIIVFVVVILFDLTGACIDTVGQQRRDQTESKQEARQ